MDKDIVFITSGIAIIILLSILVGICLTKAYESAETLRIKYAGIPYASDSSGCDNLSLENTAKCLKKNLKEFYYYNISNVDKELTLEELKEQGGVCWHYARWWRDEFIRLGAKLSKDGDKYYIEENSSKFYIKEVTFSIDNETSHRIAIVSSAGGWCALEQLSIDCFRFENKSA
jgi:hypothetical protein